MTADTQAKGDLVKLAEAFTVDEAAPHQFWFTRDGLEAFAAALQGRGTQEGEPSECRWTYEDDPTFAWNTGCGNMFSFIDGNPKENDFKFCCYCGGPLVQEQT